MPGTAACRSPAELQCVVGTKVQRDAWEGSVVRGGMPSRAEMDLLQSGGAGGKGLLEMPLLLCLDRFIVSKEDRMSKHATPPHRAPRHAHPWSSLAFVRRWRSD